MFLSYFTTVWILFLISWIDIKYFIIPNNLILFLLGINVFIDIFIDYEKIPSKVIFAFCILCILLIIYFFVGGIGAGDLKLIAVICYSSGFYAGVLGISIACFSGIGMYLLKNMRTGIKLQRLPFAPFLTIGYLVSYWLCRGIL